MVFPRLLCVLGLHGLLVFSPTELSATDLQKLSCTEAEAIEAKCKAYDAETKACEAQSQEEGKAQINAAKKAQDDCKKKHAMNNTPKQALNAKVQRDLEAKPETSCAKAVAIGKEQALCKGPKKVLETMKANCIKDM
jgi:hypothetical protein